MKILLALIVSFFAIGSLQAGMEVAPFYGIRFGGDLEYSGTNTGFNLEPSAAGGAVINFSLPTMREKLELLYSHQQTDFSGGASAPNIKVNIDEWQAGLLREYGMEEFRPFLVGTLGVANFSFSNSSQDRNLFSVGLGGGFKYFPTESIGFRLDVRGYASFVDGSSAIACSGGCVAHYEGTVFWQGEITPSLVISF